MIPNKDLIEALVMVSATSAAKLIHDRMKGKVTTILMVVFQYIVAFITVYVAYPFIKWTEYTLLWTVVLSVSSAHIFEFVSSKKWFEVLLDSILRFFNLKSKDDDRNNNGSNNGIL